MSSQAEFDGIGVCVGECGDAIEMAVDVRENRISRAAFRCDGCAFTVLAAQEMARLALGRSVPDALALNALDVIDGLGGVEEEHQHCAVVAANALHDAIQSAIRLKREPWKRLYRTR